VVARGRVLIWSRTNPGIGPVTPQPDVLDRLLRRIWQVDGAEDVTGARLSALSVLVYGGPRTMSALAPGVGAREDNGRTRGRKGR
jgi:hypothetical protein